MRWLVGWGNIASGPSLARKGALQPVGAQLIWGDLDPLWAVGDWRPDEVRVVHADGAARLAVLGCCGASDDELRTGLLAARGGALRHLTAWPGSYTAVAQIGRRLTIAGDLAGARPVFYTPWEGGTAYATAALPLADLIEAQLDIGHLAALLACPDSPEAIGDGTPYQGVRRVPPGHALVLRGGSPTDGFDRDGRANGRAGPVSHPPGGYEAGGPYGTAHRADGAYGAAYGDGPYRDAGYGTRHAGSRGAQRGGSRDVIGYEPTASLAVAAPQLDPGQAVEGVREALIEAVRVRLAAPRHAPEAEGPGLDPGPVPGMGPAERRAARGAPAAGVGADLSGGSASGTLALLAAGLPGVPGTPLGHGTEAGERLLAVTFNDLATIAGRVREAELERARVIAANPRLHHVVVAAGAEALPYAALERGPLTDEPGPALVSAERHRRRLSAGSADHLVGHGARQVLDAHPARLADLLLDRRRRHLLRPATALARADGPSAHSFFVPFTVYRAARKLARTPYREGVEAVASKLLDRHFAEADGAESDGIGGAVGASLAALAWCRPGPAARWLTGEALAEVSVRLETAAARPVLLRRPGERRADASLARHAADHRVFEQAAEIRSQRLHAPFLDNQVVRACRALPEALRVQPGARSSVLRAVLAGAGIRDLPPGWGTPSHASHTVAARAGLRHAIDDLIALFDAPLLADAGLVEARVVRKALRAAADGERVPLDGIAELVSTEVWLRRLLARRGTCWTGSAAPRQRAVAGGVVPRPSL
ncbi:asparagine synthase-related protein [Streptomyces buecherae]|uniref:asparagine synthase-related protein n=1 Tax=Streptomyces buecherae TaxID=2763006 RepID=UPI001E2C577F|nr:asparagine synthase-related protein [Streptomyces buecherae]